jgi:hypothetical protein
LELAGLSAIGMNVFMKLWDRLPEMGGLVLSVLLNSGSDTIGSAFLLVK